VRTKISGANASALDCDFFFATGPAVCGDSSVDGGSRFLGGVTESPNPILTEHSGGLVTVGAVGSGPGGISGTVAASGTFGEAHIFASANSGQFTVRSVCNGASLNESATYP
jgi:hypothetical protein